MALPAPDHPRRGRQRRRAPDPRGALTAAEQLYGGAFLDHAKRPRGRGRLALATGAARRENPLCGDAVDVEVRVDDATLGDVAHQEHGCAILAASASVLHEAARGASVAQARALAARLRAALTGAEPLPLALVALAPVRLLPARHRCALLPWEALLAALDASSDGPSGDQADARDPGVAWEHEATGRPRARPEHRPERRTAPVTSGGGWRSAT